jgi:repressor LexA
MKDLTERQKQVLQYISVFSAQNSYPPTVREIASHFAVSGGAIQEHLEALRKKNYISWADKRSRGIKILGTQIPDEDVNVSSRIPLLGSVAAGKPLLSEENYDGHVSVLFSHLKENKSYFALRVRGTSMINAGILDGDIAIIEQADKADNGQIVVAVLDDKITLKRFFLEAARVRLQSENPEFNPIYCRDVRIAGILSHIIREY